MAKRRPTVILKGSRSLIYREAKRRCPSGAYSIRQRGAGKWELVAYDEKEKP